jgi:hypothetical protein
VVTAGRRDSDLAATGVFSIGWLVPINNRIASLDIAAPVIHWKEDHKRWDSLHRVRILLLAVALAAATWALVV